MAAFTPINTDRLRRQPGSIVRRTRKNSTCHTVVCWQPASPVTLHPPMPPDPIDQPIPHAPQASLEAAAELEHDLVAGRPLAIGALLLATCLLRIGSVGAGLAV